MGDVGQQLPPSNLERDLKNEARAFNMGAAQPPYPAVRGELTEALPAKVKLTLKRNYGFCTSDAR
jgi:hypothetical protein